MMAPTLLLRGDEPVLALGSAGSNRLRSAILQTVISAVYGGFGASAAVRRPRIHPEGDGVDVEGGVGERGGRGAPSPTATRVRRWGATSLFFGGVSLAERYQEPRRARGRRGPPAAAAPRPG